MSHYQHLSIKERESILKLSAEGKGIREISRVLGRNVGTISSELKRNSGKDGYWPVEAEKQYRKRRKKCCRKRILDDPEIKAFVQQKILDEQWSPEQIANRAKLENSPCQVSHPTIYRAIHAGRLEVRKLSHGERGIARKLRHRGKTRRKKGEEETRGKLRISHPIEERPYRFGGINPCLLSRIVCSLSICVPFPLHCQYAGQQFLYIVYDLDINDPPIAVLNSSILQQEGALFHCLFFCKQSIN